jgi:hypothetical protein
MTAADRYEVSVRDGSLEREERRVSDLSRFADRPRGSDGEWPLMDWERATEKLVRHLKTISALSQSC